MASEHDKLKVLLRDLLNDLEKYLSVRSGTGCTNDKAKKASEVNRASEHFAPDDRKAKKPQSTELTGLEKNLLNNLKKNLLDLSNRDGGDPKEKLLRVLKALVDEYEKKKGGSSTGP